MHPFVLPPNRFSRFYEGGARIDALRGDPPGPERTPEDWVGSTATSLGSTTEGLAHLEDGRVLKDLIEADPEGFLGPEHVARHGMVLTGDVDGDGGGRSGGDRFRCLSL